jgi:peptidoglycan hydrolase CwlO-like protein
MKLSIVLILFSAYLCNANDIWYQREIATWLVPTFQYSYMLLQGNILNKLSTFNSNSLLINDDAFALVASNLYCEMDKLIKALDVAVTSSNNIRIKVDQKLASLMNEIAAKEKEVAQTNNQIENISSKIQSKEVEIVAAEQSVRQIESSVADAENALQRAEKEVADAQLCAGLIGRKKRFLGSIWNSIQTSVIKPIESAVNTAGSAITSAANTAGNAITSAANTAGNAITSAGNTVGEAILGNVVKPVCTVINFQQVDSTRRNVENKKNELAAIRNQLYTLQNDLNSMKNDLVIYSTQVYNLYHELTQLHSSLLVLPTEQHIILEINQKLASVAAYIRSSFSGSASFFDKINTMVSFDLLIQPLNTIYDELQQNQLMTSLNTGKISTEQFDQAKIGLRALTVATVNMPFLMESINCAA